MPGTKSPGARRWRSRAARVRPRRPRRKRRSLRPKAPRTRETKNSNLAPKPRRQHIALGRILPARGRLDMPYVGIIALQLRQQFGIGAALERLCQKAAARFQNLGGK